MNLTAAGVDLNGSMQMMLSAVFQLYQKEQRRKE